MTRKYWFIPIGKGWGSVLMDRRESILARMENRPLRNLNESDYLLGVLMNSAWELYGSKKLHRALS